MNFKTGKHWSDCAVHNEPATPNGPCDCDANAPAGETVVTAFVQQDGDGIKEVQCDSTGDHNCQFWFDKHGNLVWVNT